jgi:hypothetical protein
LQWYLAQTGTTNVKVDDIMKQVKSQKIWAITLDNLAWASRDIKNV